MDVMQLRRNLMMQKQKRGGTSDFWIENVAITYKKQVLDLKLLNEDKAFTVLCDYEILSGYNTENYRVTLDAFSCGEKGGDFTEAVRIGHYTTLRNCRLNNTGTYEYTRSELDLHSRAALRYDPEQENKLWARLSGQANPSIRNTTIVLNEANAVIGGYNGNNWSDTSSERGIIYGLYVYRRSLTADAMNAFIDNGIVP